MVENANEIVLDASNKVLVGPDGYFKVVIDDFDGTQIKAWHFEDVEGNKSVNLAERGKGKHIDLLANIDSRTVAHFTSRWADRIIKDLQKSTPMTK